METWHPLGVVGVISAFNFPAAVWAWNAALALVCGDTVVWKPSEQTPLIAAGRAPALLERAAARRRRARGPAPAGRQADATVGEPLVDDPRVRAGQRDRLDADGPRRSARGSPPASAGRCSSSAATTPPIVAPSADLDLAVRGIVFAAAGTAGPALHDAAPADRARVGRRRSWSTRLAGAYRSSCRSATRSTPARWSAR